MKKIIYFLLFLIVAIALGNLFFNNKKEKPPKPEENISNNQELRIVTTIFPAYDVAKNIIKNNGEVLMLLPPGEEAHHYELKPSDFQKIKQANLILAIRPDLDGIWLKVNQKEGKYFIEVDGERKEVVFLGLDIGQTDPHIWNNFPYLANMISRAQTAISQINSNQIFKENAQKYKDEVYKTHYAFSDMLKKCRNPEIFFVGHNSFSYWEKYYGLTVHALQGFSPDAQSSVFDVANFISQISRSQAKYVFYDILDEDSNAVSVAQETGTILLTLYPGHNLGKNDFNNNVTLLDLARKNINNIAKSLICQP